MVLELLEDSVVVMDAVVASSRDEGVHGRSLPDTTRTQKYQNSIYFKD